MIKSNLKNDDIESRYGLRMYACDFETTTSSISKVKSWVWAFAYDEIGKYSPQIEGSIEAFFDFCADPAKGTEKRLYFHNLKFDGEFILYYLIKRRGFVTRLNNESGTMERTRNLMNGDIIYVISDTGQWYYIAFKYKNILIEIRDSLKLMPFTLEQIGESFCKKYKKSSMNYDDKKSLDDCTESDIEYIKNDVLVLSEALSFMFQLQNEESPFKPVRSLTIGGACLKEFQGWNYGERNLIMVKLDKEELPPEAKYLTKDEYIRSAYRGGYCYVNKKIQGKLINREGFTADVNSLYPFVMSNRMSGSLYPIGKGHYKKGKPEKKYEESDNFYFYMRISVSFKLRKGFVPTIQKKGSFLFVPTAYLESSAMMDYKTGKYIGDPKRIELTLSKDDWILFQRHYEIIEIEYIDYINFGVTSTLFTWYVDFYADIKKNSTGAVRSLAKLFSNNLYGQMAKSTNSSYKLVHNEYIRPEAIEYEDIEAHEKTAVNIAIGAAITAKARRYQIETIQNNLSIFCYSDTDSLHCIGKPEQFKGRLDNNEYGAYKIENIWKRARFVRQKTYIEEGLDGYLNICAAGMTAAQKEKFRELYKLEDFKTGLTIHGGKLKPKRVVGGVILEEVDFTIR